MAEEMVNELEKATFDIDTIIKKTSGPNNKQSQKRSQNSSKQSKNKPINKNLNEIFF